MPALPTQPLPGSAPFSAAPGASRGAGGRDRLRRGKRELLAARPTGGAKMALNGSRQPPSLLFLLALVLPLAPPSRAADTALPPIPAGE